MRLVFVRIQIWIARPRQIVRHIVVEAIQRFFWGFVVVDCIVSQNSSRHGDIKRGVNKNSKIDDITKA